MKRDFGFFMMDDFDKPKTKKDFLNLFSRFSEYELLKYNVVIAFVDSGGGKQDNEVYSLVKLLELTFHTTLGFPKKLCNSNNMYSCNSSERAKVWRNYLTKNNLLKNNIMNPIHLVTNKMPAANNEGFRCVRSTNNENPVERNRPTVHYEKGNGLKKKCNFVFL